MIEPNLANLRLDDEEFFALALRYLDGLTSPDEELAIADQFQVFPERRDQFVALCRHAGMLRETFSSHMHEDEGHASDTSAFNVQSSPSSLPPVIIQTLPSSLSPVPAFLGGMLFSYLIAAMVVGLGLLVAAAWTLPNHVQFVDQPSPKAKHREATDEPRIAFVGQITGMVDCVWEGSGFRVQGSAERGQQSVVSGQKATGQQPLATIHYPLSTICLGDCIALKSGLMEITYNTGAKVILEGPVTYEVESPASGYLSVGKLTARLEKKVASSRESSSHQPLAPSPLFAIRTPTAVVTDLGTEFGVEVDESGATQSHVFRGSVTVRLLAGPAETREVEQVLHENESTRVGRYDQREIIVVPVAKTDRFVREMPKQTVKTFDLVDVVAGGDGYSGRRGRGIDPTTGLVCLDQPDNADTINAQGDYKYHRVEGVPFVDGVFIPDGRSGPVQIDSAGHVFPDCPTTDNWSHAYLWAGGKLSPIVARRVSTVLADVDYASSDHTLLLVHSNKGITFDLDAIRKANAGYQVLRLRGIAGNVEPESEKGVAVSADIWVLVDGQVRFKRREINGYMGAMPINIPIANNDRFLTLAATDGGNSYMCDQIMFGDLHLELVTAKPPVKNTKRLP